MTRLTYSAIPMVGLLLTGLPLGSRADWVADNVVEEYVYEEHDPDCVTLHGKGASSGWVFATTTGNDMSGRAEITYNFKRTYHWQGGGTPTPVSVILGARVQGNGSTPILGFCSSYVDLGMYQLEGHIDSEHNPFDKLAFQSQPLPPYPDITVSVYCRSFATHSEMGFSYSTMASCTFTDAA